MIDTIFLDLDGVLANFVESAIRAHERDQAEVLKNWPQGEYDITKVLGIESYDAFWEPLDAFQNAERYSSVPQGARFWAGLEPYPWRDLLWNLCEERAETFILSSPSRHPGSSFGKVHWLRAWKGETFRRYVLAPKKTYLARPGALLIDDDEKNCATWTARGGSAICFPRKWNPRHERADRPMETVLPELLSLTFKQWKEVL